MGKLTVRDKMKKIITVLILTLVTSQVAWANRFGDAWEASHSRIHGRFARGRGNTASGGLFLTSSTTITSLSSMALTTGGSLLQKVALRDEFLDQNLYAVMVDSAKGQGEYLQTLAALSGCDGVEAQGKFSSAIRSNFKSVYGSSTSDPAAVSDQVDQMIQNDSELRKSCQLLPDAA
jgi:hypothetical protein